MRIFYWSWLCMKMLIFGLVIAIVVISGCTGNIDRSTKEVYQAKGTMVNITSGNMTYPAYLAAPSEEARKPAIVLVHSNRGLEPGYRNLTDRLASVADLRAKPRGRDYRTAPSQLSGLPSHQTGCQRQYRAHRILCWRKVHYAISSPDR